MSLAQRQRHIVPVRLFQGEAAVVEPVEEEDDGDVMLLQDGPTATQHAAEVERLMQQYERRRAAEVQRLAQQYEVRREYDRTRPRNQGRPSTRQQRRRRQGQWRCFVDEMAALEDIGRSDVGQCDIVCRDCQGKRWSKEAEGMCCLKGKVYLHPLRSPPPEIWALLTMQDAMGRHFRLNIRKYNATLNMASSTAKVERNFPDGIQAFRINGVVHHSKAFQLVIV